jgi:RNA polymerase sigma-70 factor (ECF subfamily)
MYRNKVYSLDADDGIEASVIARPTNSPDAIMEKKEQRCRLCRAINSLPESQGKRIEAHYLHGKSQAEIAAAEGVTKGAVSISITRGLMAMKIILQDSDFQLNFCPQSDMVYRGIFFSLETNRVRDEPGRE